MVRRGGLEPPRPRSLEPKSAKNPADTAPHAQSTSDDFQILEDIDLAQSGFLQIFRDIPAIGKFTFGT
jgi:hypothetical protein